MYKFEHKPTRLLQLLLELDRMIDIQRHHP